jgi:hypothetical protein
MGETKSGISKTSSVCYRHSSNPAQDNAPFTDTYKQEMDSPRVAQAATFHTTFLSEGELFQSRSEHPAPNQGFLPFVTVSSEILIETN